MTAARHTKAPKPRGSVDIRRLSRAKVPAIPFERITRKVLGPAYTLSIVFTTDALARTLNKTYRDKEYVPNVLSFPLEKTEGEIFLNVRKAAHEAKEYGCSLRERVAYLFVHGLFHLGGYHHGRTMESAERRIMREFKLSPVIRAARTHAKSLRRH